MPTLDPITTLQNRIDHYWSLTDCGVAVQVQTETDGNAAPHVIVIREKYHIIVEERGKTISDYPFLTLEKAARWYLHGMAERRAQTEELRDRIAPTNAPAIPHGLKDDGYSRWNWMGRSIELMHKISSEHGSWMRAYYMAILAEFPLEEYEIRNARWPLK